LPEARSRGEAVRRTRISRGWSRRRLARVAQVDEATVKRIEANASQMARRAITAVLEALDLCKGP
jgi:transcriptional regulator with XRE-family HTH domain